MMKKVDLPLAERVLVSVLCSLGPFGAILFTICFSTASVCIKYAERKPAIYAVCVSHFNREAGDVKLLALTNQLNCHLSLSLSSPLPMSFSSPVFVVVASNCRFFIASP